jgi:hypothetical protein
MNPGAAAAHWLVLEMTTEARMAKVLLTDAQTKEIFRRGWQEGFYTGVEFTYNVIEENAATPDSLDEMNDLAIPHLESPLAQKQIKSDFVQFQRAVLPKRKGR